MDRLRTLLLARGRTLVLDADSVASAATRPSRDVDVERFEDELAQLGFVMSLDLAMTVRRLPHQAIQELKAFMLATLGEGSPRRPRRPMASYTHREQPCPWCGQHKRVGALDPCGHLVCRSCWDTGSFAGCPICHRRVALGDPFLAPPAGEVTEDELRLIDLAFDALAIARGRFERLLASPTPLSTADRDELETLIDELGPRVAIWMPPKIAVRETMAIAVARLWMVSPDRAAMGKATQGHLATASDVLRVAVVLMGGTPALAEPIRLRSLPRALRRSVLQALERLPAEHLLEDMRKRTGLWKRVGERLHPFEHAEAHPTVALGFAAIRRTDIDAVSFAATLHRRAGTVATVRTAGARVLVTPSAGPVEAALRAGDVRTAVERLAKHPDDLLRRVPHLLRLARTDEAARQVVIDAARAALPRVAPEPLLARTQRGHGVGDAIRGELLSRAEKKKPFARAVIDRALADVPLELVDAAGRVEVVRAAERPTLLDLAAIHAAARANVIYLRERDGSVNTLRRREGEPTLVRLGRVYDNPDADSQLSRIPAADAPTWVALVTCDLALPRGSAGYVHTGGADVHGQSAADLIAELAVRDMASR